MGSNGNKGKRLCDECRHFYPKSKLKINGFGQFCRKCYKRRFG